MNWLRNFMYGRYGVDQFGNFLFVTYIVLLIISLFVPIVSILCYAIIIYTLFRMFSKQGYKRRMEQRVADEVADGSQQVSESSLIDRKTNGNIVKHINI